MSDVRNDGPLTDREMVNEARRLADGYLAHRMNVAGSWLHAMADALERTLNELERQRDEAEDALFYERREWGERD